jgi:hypothetical protein
MPTTAPAPKVPALTPEALLNFILLSSKHLTTPKWYGNKRPHPEKAIDPYSVLGVKYFIHII